jgi:hypothetical protein
MARFRRVNTDQLESDLTDIANAIRAKAGTTAELPFPSGYINAVNSITANSGSSSDFEAEVAVQTELIQQIKAVLVEKGYQTAEE